MQEFFKDLCGEKKRRVQANFSNAHKLCDTTMREDSESDGSIETIEGQYNFEVYPDGVQQTLPIRFV